MGTGIRNFNFIDIEVLRNELGKPIVKTYNNLNKMCIDYNVLEIKVSISHSDNYAVSNAIAIVKE
jgi:holo-[acyl-carrier protein] synthase